MGDDGVLVLRARETAESVETTLTLCDGAGSTTPIELGGAWPEHWYLASLMSVNAGGECAVIMKTQGTPAPDDDYAVVLAKLENKRLAPMTQPFYDDALYSAGPGPDSESLAFVRPAQDGSTPLLVDLLVVSRAGDTLTQTTFIPGTDCDPGFDQDRVCIGTSDGTLVFRQSRPAGSPAAAVDLEQVSVGSKVATSTGLAFPPLGGQWLWVEER
jgi:hypothetical protein